MIQNCLVGYDLFFILLVQLGITGYGIQSKSWFKIDDLNELLMKMVYRRHNRYVIEVSFSFEGFIICIFTAPFKIILFEVYLLMLLSSIFDQNYKG